MQLAIYVLYGECKGLQTEKYSLHHRNPTCIFQLHGFLSIYGDEKTGKCCRLDDEITSRERGRAAIEQEAKIPKNGKLGFVV